MTPKPDVKQLQGNEKLPLIGYSGVVGRIIRNALICAELAMLSGCGFVVVQGIRHAYQRYDAKPQNDANAALARYRTYALGMLAEKAAAMFDPSGELSHEGQSPVVGRDAILVFLKLSFGQKVLEYEITATSSSVNGKSAVQTGHYRQKIVALGGEIVTVQGLFEARWSYQPDGQWLITRMHTTLGGLAGRRTTTPEVV